MAFDPTSVEVTCVTLPKDHCVQIPWKYIKVCGCTVTLFAKTWTKGHWPLDDLWPHICRGHMCDSTQGSLCPSPMGIHQCYVDTVISFVNYHIHTHTVLHTYYIHTTYRKSDRIVSFWTTFRRDKNFFCISAFWIPYIGGAWWKTSTPHSANLVGINSWGPEIWPHECLPN